MKNVLTLFELSAEEIQRIFAITKELKDHWAEGTRKPCCNFSLSSLEIAKIRRISSVVSSNRVNK